MTVYLTKVWGFGVPVGPLQFSLEGWRVRARQTLKPGDLVALVGTRGEPTELDERGRVLGLMEPTREVVASLDYPLVRGPQDYDEEGRYRWPFALVNRRAWLFKKPRPLLSDLTSRSFHMDAALGIVALDPEEERRVLSLPRREVPLLQSVRASARLEGEDVARKRAAPPPTTTRTGVMHLRRAPAYTYVMEIVGAPVEAYKVGWAFDFKSRQRTFNQASLPKLGGLRYSTKLFHLWDTARQAFAMEQALLRTFDSARHGSNREVLHGVSYAALWNEWVAELIQKRSSMIFTGPGLNRPPSTSSPAQPAKSG